jgi:site-specific DNA-methyltransferase (adenine-specific)
MRVHALATGVNRETPQWLFDKYHARWRFTLDVCATKRNAKCPVYFSRRDNGLAQPWRGVCWMNPPYGDEIGDWVRKATEEVAARRAIAVVALLPARTDTAWWHDWVKPFARVRFLRGRLRFGGAKKDAPFPSVIAIYPRSGGLKRARGMADPRQLDLLGSGEVLPVAQVTQR